MHVGRLHSKLIGKVSRHHLTPFHYHAPLLGNYLFAPSQIARRPRIAPYGPQTLTAARPRRLDDGIPVFLHQSPGILHAKRFTGRSLAPERIGPSTHQKIRTPNGHTAMRKVTHPLQVSIGRKLPGICSVAQQPMSYGLVPSPDHYRRRVVQKTHNARTIPTEEGSGMRRHEARVVIGQSQIVIGIEDNYPGRTHKCGKFT